jgi:hypothetical protein
VRKVWLIGLTGCQWLTDEELSARLDSDTDGVPAFVDCNDDDRNTTLLVATEPDILTGVGDELDGMLPSSSSLIELGISNCIHPITRDTLTHYGLVEDVYQFRSGVDCEATVTLRTDGDLYVLSRPPTDLDDAGSVRSTKDPKGEPPIGPDVGGVALFVWRGQECVREACLQGLPLGTKAQIAGRKPWTSSVYFDVRAGESWYLVVTGEADSPYQLDLDCLP